MEKRLTELFCNVDDFCKKFIPCWEKFLISSKTKKRIRAKRLSRSEIITILIHFQESGYTTFKHFYNRHLKPFLKSFFPKLLSYQRFIEISKEVFIPLLCFVKGTMGKETNNYFVDSTLIKVCHIKRERSHKVFKKLAKKSKSTTGWFFGFKLHLIINNLGEIMNFCLTPGNVDDRKPVLKLSKKLSGRLVGDKGYISKTLSGSLFKQGIQLITKAKKNMKNFRLSDNDRFLLSKRSLIETVNDQLKNISQIEHTRHRSFFGFAINLFSGIAAYNLKPKKPSVSI